MKQRQLKDLKQQAKHLLNKLSKEELYCYALKRKVHVTNLFWKHTFIDKPRSSEELTKRLKTLKYIKQIVQSTKKIADYKRYKSYEYYSIDKVIKGIKIRVVLTTQKDKKVELLSVIILEDIKKEAS